MIKIAILGLGTVGTGVVKVVEANTAPIQHKLGQPLSVKTALVRKLRADPYQHLMTENFREIEHDGEIRVVVETIGGVEAAYEYTRRCLMAGKHVVTANKQLVAEHGCELLELARKNHVNYLFEASVGGGIPVLHPLTQCMAANRVDEIYGILNGTTNFILTKMVKEGASFAEVLKLAQEKGYAEADPTADVEGIDAGRKVCILADMMFGKNVDPSRVRMTGISAITAEDAAFAEAAGMKLRLLGRAVRQGQALTVFVSPHFIAGTQPLAPVSGVLNAVEGLGSSVGAVMFSGPGAGGPATASAVLADVIDIVRNPGRSQPVSWPAEPAALCDPEEFESPFFFRTRLSKEACEQALGPVRWLPDAGAFHGGFTQKTTRRALRASGLVLDAVWPLLA